MSNINQLDRILRAMIGVLLFGVAFYLLTGGWQIAAYVIGAVLIITSAVSFCPLYQLLGINQGKGSNDKR